MRADGEITRGTTGPNRLRRPDRWIGGPLRPVLIAAARPLVVDLGYGASPVTTLALYRMVRNIAPGAEVTGLEIDPDRVSSARKYLSRLRTRGHDLPGLSFAHGGFELPVPRPPVLVRAFNVLRQYPQERVSSAWERLRSGLAPNGVLIEGTCDELGRRAVWVTLPADPHADGIITFSTRLASLDRPSDLAERLPKALIHRNVPGQAIHSFLHDFDKAWATTAPYGPLGRRQRWLHTVRLLAHDWPVFTKPPYGGGSRWRLGEISLPWDAIAMDGVGWL
ncbi:MAG TPA: class I SAM-dependent methyltransferase [Streptosporangiaceae bacterium]|nr:class I SAM-dependent methyltransferase [Streptosporangiaceae bacterium]